MVLAAKRAEEKGPMLDVELVGISAGRDPLVLPGEGGR